MAENEIDAKVNMSLDDIIKMEKKKKAVKTKKPGVGKKGKAGLKGVKGGVKKNAKGAGVRATARSAVRGNQGQGVRARSQSKTKQTGTFNKRGLWKKFPQNIARGGFIKKKFGNKPNLRRSRSQVSMNRANANNQGRQQSMNRANANNRGRQQSMNRANANNRGRQQSINRANANNRGRQQSMNRANANNQGRQQSMNRMNANNRGRQQSMNRGRQQSMNRGRQQSMNRGRQQSMNRGRQQSVNRGQQQLAMNIMNANIRSRSRSRGRFPTQQGRFGGMARSRSRTNYMKPQFMNPMNQNQGFLQRTNSMPNLQDPASIYNRLGYQSPSQMAYRNKLKRAKNVLNQRQTKAMRMQEALSLAPKKTLSPRKQPMNAQRQFAGGMHSDQLLRAQRQAQYQQKLLRMNTARANLPSMNYLNPFSEMYQSNPSAMSYYPEMMQEQGQMTVSPRQMQRGRSPFQQSLQSLKAAAKSLNRQHQLQQLQRQQRQQQQQRRARSRSRSRMRSKMPNSNNVNSSNNNVNSSSVISLTDAADLEDRSFSEVMYSLSNNFGVTGRTLHERFSLF